MGNNKVEFNEKKDTSLLAKNDQGEIRNDHNVYNDHSNKEENNENNDGRNSSIDHSNKEGINGKKDKKSPKNENCPIQGEFKSDHNTYNNKEEINESGIRNDHNALAKNDQGEIRKDHNV